MEAPPAVSTLTELTAAQRFQVVELTQRVEQADGLSPLNEAGLLALTHGADQVAHVTVADEEHVLGYGQLQLGETEVTGQLFVDASHRCRGIGGAVLAGLERVAVEAGRGDELRLWALGNLPGAQALAASADYLAVRELLIMTRSLTAPMAKPEIPEGFEIRPFRVGADENEWLALNAKSFRHHPEQGQMTLADLHARMAEPWFDPAGFFLAVADQKLVGFHWTKRHTAVLGEVYVLGVDPDVESRGLGSALLQIGLDHLREHGAAEVLLYVEGDHPRAVGLYTSRGFTVTNRDVMYGQVHQPADSR